MGAHARPQTGLTAKTWGSRAGPRESPGSSSESSAPAGLRPPRGRDGGRGRVWSALSSNGRPGTRQGSRTPHLRAAWPVDACSLAVACGGRGVSLATSCPPAVRHRRAARCPSPGTTGTSSPSRATPRATTVFRHAGTRPADARPRAVAAFRPFVACLRPRATANVTRPCPCDASTAYAAPCSEALRAALRRHHTPGASVRQRRLWRP